MSQITIQSTTKTTTNLFPLSFITGLLFLTLKLCGVIDWSWWWVLSPFWIPPAIFVLVVLALVLVFALFPQLREAIKKS